MAGGLFRVRLVGIASDRMHHASVELLELSPDIYGHPVQLREEQADGDLAIHGDIGGGDASEGVGGAEAFEDSEHAGGGEPSAGAEGVELGVDLVEDEGRQGAVEEDAVKGGGVGEQTRVLAVGVAGDGLGGVEIVGVVVALKGERAFSGAGGVGRWRAVGAGIVSGEARVLKVAGGYLLNALGIVIGEVPGEGEGAPEGVARVVARGKDGVGAEGNEASRVGAAHAGGFVEGIAAKGVVELWKRILTEAALIVGVGMFPAQVGGGVVSVHS